MNLLPKEERTRHLIAAKATKLSTLIESELGLDRPRVEELLHRGAIYLNKNRVTQDLALSEKDYVRVHLQPRRFPAAEIDWKSRLVAETEDLVVVNKPPEVPVPPTLDNLHENVLACASEAFGTKLWITHRLDLPTQGLVVLARSRRFQSLFNKWLNEGRVEKRYRALTAAPVATGTLVHWQKFDKAAPKQVSAEPIEDWLRCELEVLANRPHAEGNEVEIRLVTGRTHQIRCQLAAIGAPLLGDTLYGGASREGLALQAYRLALPDRRTAGATLHFELPAPW